MMQTYRGFTIDVHKEKCLGGWTMCYVSVFRNDGLELASNFGPDNTPVRSYFPHLRLRIDQAISSKGETEFLSDMWGDWKEPRRGKR